MTIRPLRDRILIPDRVGGSRALSRQGRRPTVRRIREPQGCPAKLVGGVALLRAAEALAKLEKVEKDDDRKTGIRIVKRALEEPLRQIADNAGVEGSVVVNDVKELEQNVELGEGY